MTDVVYYCYKCFLPCFWTSIIQLLFFRFVVAQEMEYQSRFCGCNEIRCLSPSWKIANTLSFYAD